MSDDRTSSGDEVPRLRVVIASDHEAFRMKEKLALALREDRHTVKDQGVHGKDDTSDFVEAAALATRAVLGGEADVGIVVSNSGPGASIIANKQAGVRAAYCTDTVTARQSRRQLDANVLCLGSRVVGDELATEIARAWLGTSFSGEQRHERLVDKLQQLEDPLEPAAANPAGAADSG